MKLDELPRLHFAALPTPLQEAPRLAKAIGMNRLFIKRDDNTGLAMGGNKARKLEFIMADALNQGADVVLTCGGAQSNHVRMTAAAARQLGMDCIIFIPDPMPERFEGNLLLDAILGSEMRFFPDIQWEQLEQEMDTAVQQLQKDGRKPYLIPVGGSVPLGALGYVNAVAEARDQLSELRVSEIDMVVALGSGGTTSGLLAGTQIYMPDTTLIGICVGLGTDTMLDKVAKVSSETARLIDMADTPDMGRLKAYDEYVGEGYGIATPGGKEAIIMAARTEGIILDPVYTGKAMAGLIDLVRKGKIGTKKPILFWHTGGAPALFANSNLFKDECIMQSRLGNEQ